MDDRPNPATRAPFIVPKTLWEAAVHPDTDTVTDWTKALSWELPDSPLLQAHVPIQEAMENWLLTMKNRRPHVIKPRTSSVRPRMMIFDDYVIGMCPVRNSMSLWLHEEAHNAWWTCANWGPDGKLVEADGKGQKAFEMPWPRPCYSDTSEIYSILMSLGPHWIPGGDTYVAFANFGEVYVGRSPDFRSMLHTLITRALVTYHFDMEWGAGAFDRSCEAAQARHKKAAARVKRRLSLGSRTAHQDLHQDDI